MKKKPEALKKTSSGWTPKPSPEWQGLTVKFRLPPDVEAVRVILHGPSDAHAPGLCGTVWWDDLRLAPGPGKETSTDS